MPDFVEGFEANLAYPIKDRILSHKFVEAIFINDSGHLYDRFLAKSPPKGPIKSVLYFR